MAVALTDPATALGLARRAASLPPSSAQVLGNFVHVDRFGYVRRALHGTRRLSRAEVHRIYGRLEVDLRVTQVSRHAVTGRLSERANARVLLLCSVSLAHACALPGSWCLVCTRARPRAPHLHARSSFRLSLSLPPSAACVGASVR